MTNILKALSGEINKDDYKSRHKFFQERASNLFTHEYLTPHLYLDINSHASCLFEIFKLFAAAKSTLRSII